MNLHKIPGLSERFVYFNDDTFINNYVSEDDFFKGNLPRDSAILNTVKMDRRGITHIIVNNLCVISEHFIFKKQFRENWRKWISIKYGKEIFRTLCLLPWNRYSGFYELHILTLRKHFVTFGIVNLSICLKCANINLETIKMLTNGL